MYKNYIQYLKKKFLNYENNMKIKDIFKEHACLLPLK